MITSLKIVHGLVALLAFQQAPNPKFVSQLPSDPVWKNASVTTVETRCAWGAIETADGKYDWSIFDAAVAQAKATGKPVALSVTFGTFTPAWVYHEGALPQTIHMNDGTTQIMPWPWDPVLLAKEAPFIRAFGARYDPNPNVSYAVIAGAGRQLESYCVESPADIQAFESEGGEMLWYTVAGNLISLYAAAFPHTPIVMAIAPPTPDQLGINALSSVIAGGMQWPRFGIRSDGLRPNYDLNGPVAALLRQYEGHLTGFQFSLPAANSSMSPYFAIANEFDPRFIECFPGDVENAEQAGALSSEAAALK